MRVLLIAEFVRHLPWSPTLWAVDLARGLAARGCEVTALLDGCEDPGAFIDPVRAHTGGPAPPIALERRNPLRQPRDRRPLRFQRWAEQRARAIDHDASLSLTRFVPADVWAPIGPPAATEFAALVRSRSPATLAIESLQNPWVLASVAAERRARRWARRRDAPVARAHIGASPGSEHTTQLGFASRLDPYPPEEQDRLRARVRDLLGIDDQRVVMATSAVHLGRAGLGAMLRGLAALCARAQNPESAPALIVAGRDAYSLERLYASTGAAPCVYPVGTTSSMREILSASDLAVAPLAGPAGHATGRFIADALRLGVPVVADAQAPGAALVQPTTFGTPPLGLLVERPAPEAWGEALAQACEATWRRDAREAAASVGDALAMDALVGRLLDALARARRR